MTNQEILDYLYQYRNAGNHIHRDAILYDLDRTPCMANSDSFIDGYEQALKDIRGDNKKMTIKGGNKLYRCSGYNFKANNHHLLGRVGEVHTMLKWLTIIFPNKESEDIEAYFNGD